MPRPTYETAAPASMPKVDRLRWQLAELAMLRHGVQIELSAEREDALGLREAQAAMYAQIEALRTMAVAHAQKRGECYFVTAGDLDGESLRA